ncbi:MAG: hypothetical protein Q8S02_12340 [Hydrogenophaga sp.]|nr:hypothetical protein [Hydrogenophaga sp.]
MTKSKMDQPAAHAPSGPDVVSEQVDAPTNERARRLGPDWDLHPRNLAWVSNYRDWDDVLGDLLHLFNKALNLVRGWLSR